MTTRHEYHLNGSWLGNRNSMGELSTDNLHTSFSIPTAFSGLGKGTNPEELLLSAAAGCYLITLVTLLGNRQIPFEKVELKSTAVIENDRGLRIDRIVHRPTIFVHEGVDDDEVMELTVHAEHACMVSSAIRGNVKVDVLATLAVTAAHA